MTTISELMRSLEDRDVRLWVEDGRLRFNAAKGAMSADLRERIAARRDELIVHLQTGTIETIPPAPRDVPPPLSFAQQRLWFLDRFQGASDIYNLPLALRLTGRLDANALAKALEAIVARFETLRTTVEEGEGGTPVQVINPPSSLPLPRIDLSGVPAALRLDAAIGRVAEEAARPFDLSRDLMLRAVLLELGEDDHVLGLVIHHIASDGWSLGVMVREVTAFYGHFSRGEAGEPPLPPLPIRYADFAVWQRRCLEESAFDGQVAYWKTALTGAPALLDLPTDRPRPSEQTFRGSAYPVRLDAVRTERIASLARRAGATPFMVLLAAYAHVLRRYSGLDDIVIGTPVAGRSRPETEPLLGFFVNTLALRIDASGDPDFLTLLDRARRMALDAFANQDVPFERLVDELRPERDLSYAPVFQTMLILQNAPLGRLDLPGLTVEPLDLPRTASKYDLTLALEDDGAGGLRGDIEYNTDLFDEATIAAFARHWRTLLDGALADPERPLSCLPMLDADERERLIAVGRGPVTPVPEAPFFTRIAEQAARTPDAVAIATLDGQTTTYGELEARANRLAHALRRLGAGPDERVALFVERGPDLVAGLLGILKSGAAYIPLDPVYPAERIALMLEDGQPKAIVTETALLAELPPFDGPLVCLDRDDLSGEPAAIPDGVPSGDNLAYVMFTSGSTGRPKGVQIPHRALGAFLDAVVHMVKPAVSDRLLAVTTVSFDIATVELFVPLMTGGRIVIAGREAAADGARLVEALADTGATIMQATPVTWKMLVAAGWTRTPGLTAISGGEALTAALADSLIARAGRVWNIYGPTETAVWSAARIVDGRREGREAVETLGFALPNETAYVLDERMEPVPVWVRGELYIGGVGLARGYIGRPDLTAERFVADPFGPPGARLYRTGDRVRRLPSGDLEFLGRADQQVKVRGFRIELGEIEAALACQPGVGQAAVTVHAAGEERRLVGYVVPADPASPPLVATLRQALRERLPDYMVPASFVVLDRLPLTPNNKVDRKALPVPEEGETETPYRAPATAAEAVMSGIWAEVLGVERVGIDDNFFDRGGDSIASIRVVARARQAGLHLTPKMLFQHQTVAELAAAAATGGAAGAAVEQGLVTGSAPLTPVQRWFFGLGLAEPHHFNQSITLEVSAGLDREVVRRAVAALIAHHDALRLRFGADGAEIAGLPERESFSVVDLASVPVDRRHSAMNDAANGVQASLSLNSGSLLRAAWFELGDEAPPLLLLVVHHLAVDAVSWRILLEDLCALCQGRTLPPKTTSWKTWAERTAVRPDFPPVSAAVSLPRDLAGDAYGVVANEDRVITSLDAASTAVLTRTQAVDRLLAGLSAALAGWMGAGTVAVTIEGHGRDADADDLDPSRTVGWFTTMEPLAVPLLPGAAPDRVIAALRERPATQGLETVAVFNYLGQLDQGLTVAPFARVLDASLGQPRSPLGRRTAPFEVDAYVRNDALVIEWCYDTASYRRETIERLAGAFVRALADQAGGTAHSFPLAKLAQDTQNRILAKAPDAADLYPLSPVQEGMLFHARIQPDSGMWFEQMAVRLEGDVDPERLRRSWQAMTDRHTALRTSFVWDDLDRPLQIVHARAEFPWRDIDGRNDPDATVAGIMAADRRQGFDLSAAPLTRAVMVRTGDASWTLVWSFHHIVLDGWCTTILFREVLDVYRALRKGNAPHLAAAHPYRDYIAWLAARDRDADEVFWRNELKGITAPTPLAVARPEERAAEGRSYREQTFNLDSDLTASLQTLARRQRLTLATVFLGAWAVLLRRYSGEEDVLFGMTVSGRPASFVNMEDRVGLFINTLPVRVAVPGAAPLLPWLSTLQARQLDREAHGHAPLVDIQGWGGMPRGRRMFDSLLVFENTPVASDTVPADAGFSITDARTSIEEVDVPLLIQVVPGSRLGVKLSYEGTRFDDAVIERMFGHLRAVLSGFAARPETTLAELPLIDAGERASLLAMGHGPVLPIADELVFERIARQAARTPDAVAIATLDGRTMTYGALEERATQVANTLRRMGAGPDERVALFVERDFDLVVGLLGILKSGAAYIPLDPIYPRERIALMLEDGTPKAIVTQDALAELLPPFDGALLRLDRDDLSGEPVTAPDRVPGGDDLAYVIFTSGSTGRPKGVQVSHRALGAFIEEMSRLFAPTPEDRLLAVTTVSFDISAVELYLPLVSGARIVLADGETAANAARLSDALAECGATIMQATPVTWKMLVAAGWTGTAGLTAICGGEALPTSLADALIVRAARVWNIYGPTETTVWSAARLVDGRREGSGTVETLGFPFANEAFHVLDERMEPMPVWVPGELYIGGVGLARGYIGRPDLTAEKFIDNPFRPGERLYRTGDLARRLPSGDLEFLGRADHQVKIRGFRIELGEIEAVLAQHPGVAQAATTVHAFGEDRRLVGYVVAASGFTPENDDQPLERWKMVWDGTYDTEAVEDRSFNTTGWRDSRTGGALADEDMREWVDETVAGILALKPRRVLEIGCGTGLLLSRIAPHCEYYEGWDFSAKALEHAGSLGLDHVTLRQRAADEIAGVEPGSADLVILNSVIQYFPDAGYLANVVAGAIRAVGRGGAVFIGDVRDLRLLDAYHLFAQRAGAPETTTRGQLARAVRQRVADEEELLVHPAFFTGLAGLAEARIELKRGFCRNEMTLFRYDAVLRAGEPVERAAPVWERWSDLESLRARLREADELAVRRIPDRRLFEETQALAWLAESGEGATVADLRRGISAAPPAGIEPGELRDLARDLGFSVALCASADPIGTFDAVFRRGGEVPVVPEWRVPDPGTKLFNDPQRQRRARQLVPSLRAFLKERLPSYMVPGAFVVLDALPLTANNKVDRKALPPPAEERGAEPVEGPPPRTPTEELLTNIFAEVLGCDGVGVGDSFFERGGHSLLATQALTRIRAAFGIDLPLRALFDHPTAAELAGPVDALVRADAGGDVAAPVAVPRDTPPPLSFAQQRLWFLDRLEGASPAYNMPGAFRLTGTLDRAALERAFAEVVRRHEALRTRFSDVNGVPHQDIVPFVSISLPVVDLRVLPVAEREAEVLRLAREDAAQPFDLANGPLIRVRLLAVDDRDHVLLATMHHIVSDGWSLDILGRELSALYAAFHAGEPSPLPELAVQYPDIAVWQRNHLNEEVLGRQVDYWRRQLADPPSPPLPTDRPHPATPSFRGGAVPVELPPALAQGIKAVSRRAGATLYMTLLAGFMALLGRYGRQADVMVGSPVAGRTRAEMEPLIGFFINTLVMRGDLAGDPAALDLIARVRRAALDAYANQDVPFEHVVEALSPARDLSRTPFFQTMFVWQNTPSKTAALAGLTIESVTAPTEFAKFDLTLELTEVDGAIAGKIEYAQDVFDAETVQRFAARYVALLSGIVADPTVPVSALPLMDESARAAVLRLGAGAVRPRDERRVHRLFEAQAARTPDAVALIGGETLSYAELDARANRLAHVLIGRGAGPETLVALALPHTTDAVVSVLAVLKAGAAYLPLDPDYPADRQAFMLKDAAPRIIVTRGGPAFPVDGIERVDLANLPDAPATAPDVAVEPDSLAYVLYTSGSTGQPKGVEVEHRNLANLALAHAAAFELRAGDRLLQFASLSFDIASGEIATALAAGAAVVLPDSRLPGEALTRLMAERKVTHAEFSASVLAALPFAPLPDLRVVITGGEPCPAEVAARWAKGRKLFNAYGPTEATVCVTSALYAGVTPTPIGRPFDNVEIRVVDARLNPVPVGVLGEIVIGGAAVGRGYRGRPDLTAASFVADPLGGGRLYRTGDLGRWRADGQLEFHGRADGQVKVRGIRFELGEIEAVLEAHPGVRQAAAALHGDRLVGYLVGEAEPGEALAEARKRLPAALVPQAIVVLDRMPLSPTGKLDRRALPVPVWSSEATPPRNDLERTLVGLWAEVLGLETLGIHDNFFDLGGHSLAATRLGSAIRNRMGVELPLRAVFENPTVAGLAPVIESLGSAERAVPAIGRQNRERRKMKIADHD